MSSRASQEISGLLEWSFILLESRRWECSQSQKSIIYAIVKKLGPTIINMENIHLKPQISVFGISSPQPAGCGSDVEIFRSICDDWCWSETMRDNDSANEESSLASTGQPASWPRNLILSTQTTGSPHSWAAEEKICKILSKLPGWLCLLAVNFLQIPAELNTSIGSATTEQWQDVVLRGLKG